MQNFTNTCKPIAKCLCCNGDMTLALDLGDQPAANNYLRSLQDDEDYYPLRLNYCTACTHSQLSHAVNPDILFKNYLYVSGTTTTLKKYFDWFVTFTEKYSQGKRVLDIACNDGTQLDSYKNKGYITYGIDPAKNLYELNSNKDHHIVCDYLTKESIDSFNVDFDIIIAQNVFAHNTYPKQFLELCKNKVKNDGYIFIQTSQADMILNNQFDTIYHEHISFFSVQSFCALAKAVGLNVITVERTPVHGTSFVFVLSKTEKDNSEKLIEKEAQLNLTKIVSYTEACKSVSDKTFTVVSRLKDQGHKVIGYGAAAKGNTFLNFSKIKLDYIIDDNPLKQGLYTPGSRIFISSIDKLKTETGDICVIPLAWNFFDEIKQRIQNETQNKLIKFLQYFPDIRISS